MFLTKDSYRKHRQVRARVPQPLVGWLETHWMDGWWLWLRGVRHTMFHHLYTSFYHIMGEKHFSENIDQIQNIR